MLQNIKIVLPLHCVFHGIRFKVGRLEVERLPSFFVLAPLYEVIEQIKKSHAKDCYPIKILLIHAKFISY